MEKYRDVTICADIMFVNKIPFLVTISRGIKIGMVETLANRKQPTVVAAFKSVKGIYARQGFRVRLAHMDNEFAPMWGNLLDICIDINGVSNDEHVPEVERYIHTVKERMRCIYNTVPFRRMPT
jgi:hypothetical protein